MKYYQIIIFLFTITLLLSIQAYAQKTNVVNNSMPYADNPLSLINIQKADSLYIKGDYKAAKESYLQLFYQAFNQEEKSHRAIAYIINKITRCDIGLGGESMWIRTISNKEGLPKKDAVYVRGILFYMIHVEGGTFTIGSAQPEKGKVNDEQPREVTLSNYYISDAEVTNVEFACFLTSYGSNKVREGKYKGQEILHKNKILRKRLGDWEVASGLEKDPVTHVTWYGANEYCKWLSQKTGYNYYLPTEAQWEYAARGGKKGIADKHTYSGSNKLDDVAWYAENASYRIHYPIRNKKSNQLGIYDMSGNVWEWCADWYSNNYNTDPNTHNPQGPPSGDFKVCRGGSWVNNPSNCRVAYRNRSGPSFASNGLGFRVARDVSTNLN